METKLEILPGLYIGNFKDARDAEQLSKNKVTHILSIHDSARPMLEGIKYLCIPAADSPSQNLIGITTLKRPYQVYTLCDSSLTYRRNLSCILAVGTRHFKESIRFIHECRLRGEGCLVHCLAGVSRSVTLVVAYVMTITDFGWEDALHMVRAGRSCANPNLGFQKQLQEFEKNEVHQFRQWLKEEYGENPLKDAEEAKNILGNYKEQARAEPPQQNPSGRRWNSFSTLPSLAYNNYTTET
ncbi:dual specificity protein phosphatase 22 isoform X2 [Monodelphis domestica]|uniref:dual specificity protein phosphatase 22 isoform X2 n=1 Tax=Monodelphis domestica TaxID=13616 RepID=UPI0024E1E3E5|nr:dual specificity protein phosphatase 22 isoform X2 [Monodelphis domestica]